MRVGLAFIATLLVTALALSGCSGGGGGEETSASNTGGATGTKVTTSRPGSGGGSGTGTGGSGGGGGGGGEGENQAPVGAITATISQGTVPVQVNFTLTGSDPDGDKLTWNLDLDGDDKADKSGEELPATISHNYTAAGTFNVTYTVSDDQLRSTSYRLPMNLTGSAGASQLIAGSWAAGGFGCALYPTGPGGSYEEVFYFTATLDPLVLGQPYTATLAATPSGSQAFLDLIFVKDDGDYLSEESYWPPLDGSSSSPTGSVTYSGNVPLEAAFIVAHSCGPGGTIDMKVGADAA